MNIILDQKNNFCQCNFFVINRLKNPFNIVIEPKNNIVTEKGKPRETGRHKATGLKSSSKECVIRKSIKRKT